MTATKALLQSLTNWSQNEEDVTEVSGKFVKFGDSYKTLKKSYSSLGVDITNLPDIPGRVRGILESSLMLEPSQESLDTFLPQIGDSVAELMQMLKDKQADVARLESIRKNNSLSVLSVSSSSSSLRQPSSAKSTTTVPSTGTSNTSLDINRTPSKDPITRLQNNTDLMRRASKRYSAYQTSSIISMQSPKSTHVFDNSDLPKTPLYNDISTTVTADELDNAKNSNDLFNIDETGINNENTQESKETIQNDISDDIEKHNIINDTARKLAGGYAKSGVVDIRPSSNDVQNKYDNQIFLELKNQVKKVNIMLPTTIANLKILFTQKFNYSPPGISAFPKIYIQEDRNSIAYELEDIADLKYGSIVSLQQPDIQTAIFQHVDSQIDNVKNNMMNMEDRIMKKIEQMQLVQTPKPISSTFRQSADVEFEKNMKKKKEQNDNQRKLIEDLQDEINRIKQHQARSIKRITNMVEHTIGFVDTIQESGMIPNNMNENEYVKECKTKVSEGCESLVERLDDLQDVIEFMKRDITKHSMKPSQKQLDHLAREMKNTKDSLIKLTDYTQLERKNLSSMWNKQMVTIAADQKFFKAQEEIMGLLEQDYQSAQETFDLIVSCAKQLENGSLFNKSRLPIPDPSVSPWDASKLVMAEVDAINPNHEERVEAILKAERVREMEKEVRLRDEFQEELGDFVSNDKLKKSGGISEIEKIRQERDLENIKNTLGVV